MRKDDLQNNRGKIDIIEICLIIIIIVLALILGRVSSTSEPSGVEIAAKLSEIKGYEKCIFYFKSDTNIKTVFYL